MPENTYIEIIGAAETAKGEDDEPGKLRYH